MRNTLFLSTYALRKYSSQIYAKKIKAIYTFINENQLSKMNTDLSDICQLISALIKLPEH